MLRFIVQIIDIIEQRGVVKIQELANLMKLSIKDCFAFGYPNLFTFIQAFPDVFVYTPSKSNTMRGDVKINNQCICKHLHFIKFFYFFFVIQISFSIFFSVTKEGCANFVQFTSDNNNNNNNNDTNIIDFNKNSFKSNLSNVSIDFTGEAIGATSLAYQAAMRSTSPSFTSSTSSGYVGSLEMNIHPAFDNCNTFSTENTNHSHECDTRYPMHSTKLSTNESFELFDSAVHKSFEMNLNSTSHCDDKESSVLSESMFLKLFSFLNIYRVSLFFFFF